MLARQRTTTRFRCGHCGNRLVIQNRHLRRLVACHACGRPTHPVASRLMARQPVGLAEVAPVPRLACPAVSSALRPSDTAGQASRGTDIASAKSARVVQPATAATGPLLELSLAPLAPALLVGVTGAAFFVAVSLMSYVGGFVSALLLVATAAVGLRWLKRGTVSVRGRLDQIEAMRLRHGTLRVLVMLAAWFWSQPGRRKPWACLLMLFWGVLYAPYCISGIVLYSPHVRAMRLGQ